MELDCRPFLDAGSSASKMEPILQLYACGTPISSDNYPLWEGISPAQAAGFMQDLPLPFRLPLCYTEIKPKRNKMNHI